MDGERERGGEGGGSEGERAARSAPLSTSPRSRTGRRGGWGKPADGAQAPAHTPTHAATTPCAPPTHAHSPPHTKKPHYKKKPFHSPVGSLKDLLYKRLLERQLAAARGLISGPELPPEEDGPGGGGGPGGLLPTAGAKGGYVPPSVRARAAGATSGGAIMGDLPRRDDNSVRVTNLSEDTREDDLRDLFAPFGQVTRVYIAVDRETGESRGFGFVNFMFRADAQRAIDKLDGFGFDNLILRVEFAAPRPERPM